MSDYISREAAIDAVREKLGCETCNGSNVGIICTFCNVGEAILMIKNIPAADVELVRRWIPCSEKMPETNGKDASYLVYVPSFGAVDIAAYHPDVDEWTFMGLPVTVTHWMPLPELPKEVSP